MHSHDDPVHSNECTGCEMCKTFELASRLLTMLSDRSTDFSVEMNALIVAAGYKAGRDGEGLNSVLDAFRYAYILGRRERDNPEAGGLSPGAPAADWCPTRAEPPVAKN